MTCPNCKKTLTCGCQKKKASDGKDVCVNCISAYENSLSTLKNTNPVIKIIKNG